MAASRGVTKRVRALLVWRWCDDSGAELVEAALVVPLLLTLLLGTVWLGRAYNVYETITRAAREGDRYAVLPSCVSCTPSNAMADTYTAAGTTTSPACLGNPTYAFTSYIAPALSASKLDPNAVKNFCQQAIVINPNTDSRSWQCGVQISFQYPVPLAIPFTSLNATTINIPTSVTMRMEDQPVDASTGAPACP